MKYFLFLIIVFLFSSYTFSQNLTAKIIDKSSQQAIPFASIKTGEYSGVISNEEGFFTININDIKQEIIISCLGYQNKTLTIEGIKTLNYIITLNEAVNQLEQVYISNSKPNADTIIARVKAKLTDNYNYNLNSYNVFRRTTDYVDFKSLEFEIEKASHVKKKNLESANKNLNALSTKIKESNLIQFGDFKGTLYCLNKDSSKLSVEKATKLLDYKNDFSINDIQEKSQKIVLTYLDTTKTYKLKTGLFKIEDSLSLKSEDFKDDDNEKTELNLRSLNKNTRQLLHRSLFYKNSFLNRILDAKYYNYEFKDITFNNGELTYIITYTPRKGNAKYTGTLFIANDSYAITRADYSYYKNRHGEKLNLKLILGIKYISNLSEGMVLFEKDSSSKYHPKYIKRASGSYFYVNRDLKFIENSSIKNKVGFSFKIEGDNREKEELLFTANNKLSKETFTAIKQDSIAPIQILNKFEKTIWENEETLEPLQEMKGFKVKVEE